MIAARRLRSRRQPTLCLAPPTSDRGNGRGSCVCSSPPLRGDGRSGSASRAARESRHRAVHRVAQRLLARIVLQVEVQFVHHIGVA